MYRPPPLRGQPALEGKIVLLIDRNQPTRDVRVRVLQNHGVEVHAAEDLSGARFLWQPNVYDLILLDVRRHLPGEALEFYEQITTASPKEHFVFLVGPPVYLTRIWPSEVTVDGASQGQWGATVRRFLTAA
jgi:CheY-like chemotaxis protein